MTEYEQPFSELLVRCRLFPKQGFKRSRQRGVSVGERKAKWRIGTVPKKGG